MVSYLEEQVMLISGVDFDTVVVNYQQITNMIKNQMIKTKELFYAIVKKRLEQGQKNSQMRRFAGGRDVGAAFCDHQRDAQCCPEPWQKSFYCRDAKIFLRLLADDKSLRLNRVDACPKVCG